MSHSRLTIFIYISFLVAPEGDAVTAQSLSATPVVVDTPVLISANTTPTLSDVARTRYRKPVDVLKKDTVPRDFRNARHRKIPRR